jgi:hypothetical protein
MREGGIVMSEQQFGLIVVIERGEKWSSVSIFDPLDEAIDKLPICTGEGSHWRTALGEALSKIELPEREKASE